MTETRIRRQVWLRPENNTFAGVTIEVEDDASIPARRVTLSVLRPFVASLPGESRAIFDRVPEWREGADPWPYVRVALGKGETVELWIDSTADELRSMIEALPPA